LSETGSGNDQQSLTPPENAAIIPALLDVEAEETKKTRQVVWLQIAVTLTVAVIAYITGGSQLALAVFSGGSVSIANGILLAWRLSRSSSCSVNEAHPLDAQQRLGDAQHQLRRLYFYVAERFFVVAALLGMCLVVLKLPQLAVLAGFTLGQVVLMAARVLINKF
jgi:small-conductance mechanosensitive channel